MVNDLRLGARRLHKPTGIKERRVLNEELLLNGSVLQFLLQDQVVGKAIIENAVTRTQHGLRGFVLPVSIQTPGNVDPRREIAVISQIVLHFITQPRAQRQVWTDPPVVLEKERAVKPSDVGSGIPGRA